MKKILITADMRGGCMHYMKAQKMSMMK